MRNGGKTLDEMRSIAIGAARSKAREMDMDLSLRTAEDMLTILDDMLRAEMQSSKPAHRSWATSWYEQASETQIRLFKRDWLKWIHSQNEMKRDPSYQQAH